MAFRDHQTWEDKRRLRAFGGRGIAGGSAQDRANSGVCVLQIRSGVAFEREHSIPVEDVVLDPIGRQVGVLQRTRADHPSDVDLFFGREVGVLLVDGCRGTLDRFIDNIDKSNRLAAATLQHLAVGAQHVAERDVHGPRRRAQPAGHRGNVEHHRQVL